MRAKSLSLQDKIAKLASGFKSDGLDRLRQDHLGKDEGKRVLKSVNARLWVHMQRNLSAKTATRPLKAFYASGTHISSLADSNNILDGCRAQIEWNETKSLQTDDFHSMSNVYDQVGFHIDLSTISHEADPDRHSEMIYQEDDLLLVPELVPDDGMRSSMHSASTNNAFIR